MNVRDSEAVESLLLAAGHERAVGEDDADLVIVNSCTVRQKAEEKAAEADAKEDAAEDEKKEKTIYYVTDPTQQSQYIAMFKAAKMDAVILTHNIDMPFIQQLESKNEGIRFMRIDADLTEDFSSKTGKKEQEEMDAALEWCRQRGLEFYAVNKDFPEENEKENLSFSRKIKADMFIDDRNVGGLPDWGAIYQMIHDNKTYEEVIVEREHSERQEYTYENLPKKKWWQF